jgi:hypothetical protein
MIFDRHPTNLQNWKRLESALGFLPCQITKRNPNNSLTEPQTMKKETRVPSGYVGTGSCRLKFNYSEEMIKEIMSWEWEWYLGLSSTLRADAGVIQKKKKKKEDLGDIIFSNLFTTHLL